MILAHFQTERDFYYAGQNPSVCGGGGGDTGAGGGGFGPSSIYVKRGPDAGVKSERAARAQYEFTWRDGLGDICNCPPL